VLSYDFSAWWLRTSSKLNGKKSKKQLENSEMELLSRCRSIQNILPPSLPNCRRVKMEKQTIMTDDT